MVNPWVYSMIYNGLVAGSCMVLDLVVLGIFRGIPQTNKLILTKQN